MGEGSALNGVLWDSGSARASDRIVVPGRPGNAGGGKGPDFWRAFEADEDWRLA